MMRRIRHALSQAELRPEDRCSGAFVWLLASAFLGGIGIIFALVCAVGG